MALKPTEVIIVGGGPTGLFLGNLLGQAGIATVLLEKRTDRTLPSMAIGVMPPSLRMFESIGLAGPVVRAGCEVRAAVVHDQAATLGTLDLTALPPPYPFVLSIPQGDLMRLLRERLTHCPSVRILEGTEAVAVRQDADRVTLQVANRGDGTRTEIAASYAVGCDGDKSRLRDLLGLARRGGPYDVSFVMGDFPDTTPWQNEAHLFFTPHGSVEAFPLPGRQRRWIVLADSAARDTETLVRRVRELAGVQLDPGAEQWHSFFTPERWLVARYFAGRAVLCGDAAHVMSPIGGQGMNTGFGDVRLLATILRRVLATREPHAPLFAAYDASRRLAFNIAAGRAARGMWLGTRCGRLPSALRSFLIRRVLLGSSLARRLPPYFAMLTIPGADAPAAGSGTP